MSEPDPNAAQVPEEIPEAIPLAQVWVPPPPVAPPPPPPYGYSDYTTAGYASVLTPNSGRPGVVTAIGIMSIVVASLTLIGCLAVAVGALTQAALAQMSATLATTAYTSQQQAQTQQAGLQPLSAGENGLPLADRQVAISVMAAKQSLSIPHQAQLDALLAEGGKAMLDGRPGAITSDDVRRSIKSASRGRAASEGSTPPDYFTTPYGRVELYDANAVFRPDDHSAALHVQADVNRYTATQNMPDPQLAAPAPPAPVMPPSMPFTPVPASAIPPVDHVAQMMVIAEAGVSLLLAIFLLVIGILVLRNARAAGRLHWIYVVLKVPLIVLAIYAAMRYQRSLAAIVAATGGGVARFGAGSSDFATNVSFLAAGYVILLAILLMMPTVRDYYRRPVETA